MSSPVPEDAPQPRLCHVKKWEDFNGYGFNLHAERGKAGQFIGKVDENSPADAAGMREGDRIVEVNGTNIGNENHQQVVQRIKAVPNETKMLVVDSDTDQYYKDHKIVVRGDLPSVLCITAPDTSSGQPEVGSFAPASTASDSPSKPRRCHIKNWSDFAGFGFNLHAEKGKPGQFIGKVDADSPAQMGGLKEGDRILEVNDQAINQDNHQQVVQKIKQYPGETTLLVLDIEADKYYRDNDIQVTGSLPEVVTITCPDARPTVNGNAQVEAEVNHDERDQFEDTAQEIPEDEQNGYSYVNDSYETETREAELQTVQSEVRDPEPEEIQQTPVESDSTPQSENKESQDTENTEEEVATAPSDDEPKPEPEPVPVVVATTETSVETESAPVVESTSEEQEQEGDKKEEEPEAAPTATETAAEVNGEDDQAAALAAMSSAIDDENVDQEAGDREKEQQLEDELGDYEVVDFEKRDENANENRAETPSPKPEPRAPTPEPEPVITSVVEEKKTFEEPPPSEPRAPTPEPTTPVSPGPVTIAGIEFAGSVAEAKARASRKKKADPRADPSLSMKAKYDMFQKL